MSNKKLLIGIRTFGQFKKETLTAAKRIDLGLLPEEPISRLYFENQSLLFSALSPKRMELLRFLHKNGSLSIRKLANSLSRDYKNVYDDIQHLLKLGLIKKQRDQKLYMPWDNLIIELAVAA